MRNQKEELRLRMKSQAEMYQGIVPIHPLGTLTSKTRTAYLYRQAGLVLQSVWSKKNLSLHISFSEKEDRVVASRRGYDIIKSAMEFVVLRDALLNSGYDSDIISYSVSNFLITTTSNALIRQARSIKKKAQKETVGRRIS